MEVKTEIASLFASTNTPSTSSSKCTAQSHDQILTDSNITAQLPLIQSEGHTYSLPDLIYTSVYDNNFRNQLVPDLANAIAPSVEKYVQSVFKQLCNH